MLLATVPRVHCQFLLAHPTEWKEIDSITSNKYTSSGLPTTSPPPHLLSPLPFPPSQPNNLALLHNPQPLLPLAPSTRQPHAHRRLCYNIHILRPPIRQCHPTKLPHPLCHISKHSLRRSTILPLSHQQPGLHNDRMREPKLLNRFFQLSLHFRIRKQGTRGYRC